MKRSRERKSNRLKGYNYSTPGWYFVTICVKDMNCVFGDVIDENMVLNEVGKIVKKRWLWLRENFEYIGLDEFIIMPNHMHGIVIINNNYTEIIPQIGTILGLSLRRRRHNPLSKSINAFKTTSSKKIHQLGISFQWQRSFYDHIINFEKNELENIRDYIKNNPTKWNWDRENINGIW